ncbi:MAG TPA: tyrosine-type recombinase/integrase [Spirochaetota bacterium]|nr:tyrosine-type recombinase/integrase [Spirochaetota bacterium]
MTTVEFKIFKRKENNTEVWYFRVWDATMQRYTRVQTTGIKVRPVDPRTGEDPSRDAAMIRAGELFRLGKAPRRKSIRNVVDYSIDRVKNSGSTRGHVLVSTRLLERLRDMPFGKLSINQINYESILKLQDDLKAAGRPPRSINQTVALIRAACKHAVRRHFLRADPFAMGIDRLPENLRERGALTHAEVLRVLALPDAEDPRETVFSITALTTGARRSELLALQWRDVNFTENKIDISKGYTTTDGIGKTKNKGSLRFVALHSIARERLLALRMISPFPDDQHFVFYGATPGKPMAPDAASLFFKNSMTRAGITAEEQERRHLSLHSARHTFVTLYRSRATDFMVSAATGQSELQTLNRYSHAGDDQLQKSREIVEDIFRIH